MAVLNLLRALLFACAGLRWSAPGTFRILPRTSLEHGQAAGQITAVLTDHFRRIRAAVGVAVRKVRWTVKEATRPLPILTGLAADLTRSRKELLAENALLRQQLIVVRRQLERPRLMKHERALMVALATMTRTWRETVLLVKPDTVLRWHRHGFRLFWRW